MKHRTQALMLTALMLAAPAAAQEREFRLGLITPPAHAWNEEVAAMNETLGGVSGGRFAIAAYPSGELGSEADMLRQLRTGELDMAWLTTAEITTRAPDVAALHAPFLVDNVEDAARVLRSRPAREMLDGLPEATGAVGICYAMTGMRQLMTSTPVDSPGDLAGMRLGSPPAPAIGSFFEILGAAPAPMPLTQIRDALESGRIDAIDMDFETIINFRFHEHTPHMIVTNHHMSGMVALVSGPVWDAMDDEERALVRHATQLHCDRTIDRFVVEEEEKLDRLRAIPELTVTEGLGAAFFGDAAERWDAEWGARTPYVAQLRKTVAGF